MSHIFRELEEIPIPSFAHVNHGNARVFLLRRNERNKREQIVIGRATSDTTMHPNDNFKYMYPNLWAEHFGSKEKLAHELHVGLYGLFLSAGYYCNLYPTLCNSWGTANANAALDYAMFCTRERTTATYLMSDFTREQMIFSEKAYGDSFYSDFFENNLPAEKLHQFKMDWIAQCAATGHDKVWLCIDGSNNECSVQNGNLAEPGNSKTHRAVNIYSYIWAVSAKDGRPITWFLNNGSRIDSKAIEKIAQFLASSKMQIEGFIVDRGFATEEILQLIRDCGYQYVVMLKSNASAHKTMFERYAASIRWNVKYLVGRKALFGVTDKEKVFANSKSESYVALFFNGIISTRKSVDVIEAVFDAREKIATQLEAGRTADEIYIADEVKPYLRIVSTPDQKTQVEFCADKLQRVINDKGYSTIASSQNLDARRISEIYDLRDVSEKQFSIFKSQLGADVSRVHDDARIEAKFAVCFIAAIIRTEIEIACKGLRFDTNKMLREADRSVLVLMINGKYSAIHDQSDRMKKLFSFFGLKNDHLDFFAEEFNRRQSPIHTQRRSMPSLEPEVKRKRGRPKKVKDKEEDDKPKRKPGRPAGSKNKKTLEREALEALQPQKVKRKPGRPKGSKNKKTLEREARRNAPKRGRGRPKGSKNKKTLEKERRDKMTST